MLQVARLARQLLGESSQLVVDYLRSQINSDGGFKDRSGKSDLYYTVFGLQALCALQAELPTISTKEYLHTFGGGESLDFVHLTCLARCWAMMSDGSLREPARNELLNRLESFRSRDGGYHDASDSEHGTTYGCFLAIAAHQDLQANSPNEDGLRHCLKSLQTRDGAFANQPHRETGITTATAAAVTLLRHLGDPAPASVGSWLLSRCHSQGGFFAIPTAPVPDLLSTATALHALTSMQVSLNPIRESCLDFVDSLWTNQGAFYGSWADDALDCEYTYYGLLALGHLTI